MLGSILQFRKIWINSFKTLREISLKINRGHRNSQLLERALFENRKGCRCTSSRNDIFEEPKRFDPVFADHSIAPFDGIDLLIKRRVLLCNIHFSNGCADAADQR